MFGIQPLPKTGCHKQRSKTCAEVYEIYHHLRLELIRSLQRKNSRLNGEELLVKSQKLLNRLVLICFLEDRGLIPRKLSRLIFREKKSFLAVRMTDIWNEIRNLFGLPKRSRFQSGQYRLEFLQYDPILDHLQLEPDFVDRLRELFEYDFKDELDVNTLGYIFEHSISDIEELKASMQNEHHDASPSRRRQEGIFYTPDFVTEYMVKNSLGRYLSQIREKFGENELPDLESAPTPSVKTKYKTKHIRFYTRYEEELRKLRILDPACGSGAFLNRIYDYLHAEYSRVYRRLSELEYENRDQASLFESKSYRKEILHNNLYGVDINYRAVEITKLALWLKTAKKSDELIDLDENIKCGNSLLPKALNADSQPLHWEKEFPEIIEGGGFDIIIGNPPYGIVYNDELKEAYQKNYPSCNRNFDIYVSFYDLAISLAKQGGIISYISPNTFLNGEYYRALRTNLTTRTRILEIVDFRNIRVFSDPTVFVAALTCRKDDDPPFPYTVKMKVPADRDFEPDTCPSKSIEIEGPSEAELRPPNPLYTRLLADRDVGLIGDHFHIKDVGFNYWTRGGSRGQSIGKRILYSGPKRHEADIPFLKGDNIERFYHHQPDNYLKHDYRQYLNDEVDTFRFSPDFLTKKPKIIYRQTANEIIAALDEEGLYLDKTVHLIIPRDEGRSLGLRYLLGLLNSNLYQHLYRHISQEGKKRTFSQVKTAYINKLPVMLKPCKYQKKINENVERICRQKESIHRLKELDFMELVNRHTGTSILTLEEILKKKTDSHRILYEGRARKVRGVSAEEKENRLTICADRPRNGVYRLLELQIEETAVRRFFYYFINNLTKHQIQDLNQHRGNLTRRLLNLKFPAVDPQIPKITEKWEKHRTTLQNYRSNMEDTTSKLDELILDLYSVPDNMRKKISKME